MASDFSLVDIKGWEYDLHSVYTAYMGYFQNNGIPWYDRSWGHLFNSFEDFLAFSWPVITVTDSWTGRAHIVTRMTSIGAFLKMIKTRFGETLPMVDHILKITPFETHQRRLRTVNDYEVYKKLHAALPAAVLAALKVRARSGEPRVIQELWDKRDKTFVAVDFENSERNASSVLEWGYAAVRCGHLDTIGSWPPIPEDNYRRGHYVVAEYADRMRNQKVPNHPWNYAFGESQVVPKAKLAVIIEAIISSLASPDSETTPNNIVLVTHSAAEDLRRIEELKIKLPHNVLVVDVTTFESGLFKAGHRGAMLDAKTGHHRQPGSTLTLASLLYSLNFPVDYTLHNAGNDAFACLLALQTLLDSSTPHPPPRAQAAVTNRRSISFSNLPGPYGVMMPPPMVTPPTIPIMRPHSLSPGAFAGSSKDYFGANDGSPPIPSSWSKRRSANFASNNTLGVPSTETGTRRRSMLAPDEYGRLDGGSSTDLLAAKMKQTTLG
ncbi:uncharacterized protein STEHIDRAFT_71181 [Stereum hirsutum FP-91666 SS1]|uniref:uncharacterized protein n=1 Tax=Stereum hirsutum (strain FP-91666) TaxID=721885 RepID=UPI000440B00A|nr:uncharacterized protein STEHIDRAFT_71181 [Stereum hirsutum FP-91666 SS1]EIM92425.1 hypothetical protein STEHIDRAFT_71181 [Stereum hirsutum FP-91666 SS1]